jgi:dihydrodipicolinate synthase/N-acetylneuraminate lyase
MVGFEAGSHMPFDAHIRQALQTGLVIPAHPLALTPSRRLDERRQRALTRYYIASGAGGLAVGVHTTQFAIREPRFGLFEPVLALAAEEMTRSDARRNVPLVRIGGVCGRTAQAVREVELLRDQGYHIALVSLAAWADAEDEEFVAHCRAVAGVLPIMGFYLQPAVGGRRLPYRFWRRLAEIPDLVAVKIAPFNRYQSIDVMRAVADSGRDDVALYTGNDDNIVLDLLTPYRFCVSGTRVERRMVGGLLGHWAVWTQRAVQLLDECHAAIGRGGDIPANLIRRAIEVTDCNAAFFDAAHGFAGCIAGIHEVLRRQGLLQGIWCLDPRETLSPGQGEEIERVYQAYPRLNDDDFVAEHRDDWLR